MTGARAAVIGALLLFGARPALADPTAGPAPATPAAAAPTPPGDSAQAAPSPAPAPAPQQQPAPLTVGLPQPSAKRINKDIGIGIALTYVGIPVTLIGGLALGVGFLADSDPVKIGGGIVTAGGLALFVTGIVYLTSGSEQGPQPQQATSSPRVDLPSRRSAFVEPAPVRVMMVPVAGGRF